MLPPEDDLPFKEIAVLRLLWLLLGRGVGMLLFPSESALQGRFELRGSPSNDYAPKARNYTQNCLTMFCQWNE
jgi:hypothetical protein